VPVVASLLTALATVLAGCQRTSSAASTSPDYTLTLSPATLNAGLGGSATTTLQLAPVDGFHGTLALSLLDSAGKPAYGLTMQPTSVALPAGTSTPVRIAAASSVPAGTYHLTLRASGGGVTHGKGLTLTLTGTGTGAFAPAGGSPYAAGTHAESLALADINGDGSADLATANDASSGTVSVLLGDGTGAFAPASGSPVTTGSYTGSLVVGDVNGDGQPDVAAANFGDDTVSVLLGDGAGAFAPAGGSPYAAGPSPYGEAVGDFDGNGTLDLAVADDVTPGAVSVLLGNGDGSFPGSPSHSYSVGGNPAAIAVADFNGDGNPDLAVATYGTVAVLLGDGTGAFAPASGSPYSTGNGSQSVAVADFNGDGNLDIATGNRDDDTVSVLLGDGTGAFAPASGSPYSTGSGTGPAAVAAGDFNGDGVPDLATANEHTNDVSVLLGNGDGTFPASPTHRYSVGSYPDALAAGDVDGDGKLDLVTANYLDATVSVLLGQ